MYNSILRDLPLKFLNKVKYAPNYKERNIERLKMQFAHKNTFSKNRLSSRIFSILLFAMLIFSAFALFIRIIWI